MEEPKRLISVAEYAKNHDVSVQAVYKRLRAKSVSIALEGHIFEQNKVKYLDSYAVDYLETSGRGTGVIISNYNAEIEEARKTIEEQQKTINDFKDLLLAEKDKTGILTEQLMEARIKALEGENAVLRLETVTEQAEEQKEQNIALQEQVRLLQKQLEQKEKELETETTRKLTFKERFFGRK